MPPTIRLPMFHEVNLVYIISAYRLPRQLLRLVTRLQGEGTTFLVHIDKKCDPAVFATAAEGLGRLPNVHLLERHVCHWGGFGHVEASLKGIEAIVERRLPCDHAVLLTGQDFPIKSNEFIQNTLGESADFSFLQNFPLPDVEIWPPDGGERRIAHWHLWIKGRHVELPHHTSTPRFASAVRAINALVPDRRSFLPGLRPYGGSGYWMLSREAVLHVHNFVRQHPEFVSFFRRTLVPDELFFQTLLMNSELRQRVKNDDLRYIDWSAQHSSPAVLTVDDFHSLRASHALFARKFDEGIDSDILDLVEECLL